MNRMLPLSTALLLGLAGAGGLHAQQFRPGWVLPLPGDTLRGEVEDAAWDESPARIRFRAGPTAVPTTVETSGLQAFRVQGGQYFRRETLPLDRTARTNINELAMGLRVQQQSELVLAEVVVDGPASLLHFAVHDVQHYFVRRPGQAFVEVTERNYLRLKDGRRQIADGNNYRAVLGQYFGDCPAAAAEAGRVPFTAAGLSGIVQAFNAQCSGAGRPGAAFASQPTGRRFAFSAGPVGGVRYSSLQVTSDQASAPLNGADFDGNGHPVGGVYLDVLFPGRRGGLHAAGLLSSCGRSGAMPSPFSGGSGGYVDTRQLVLECRLGGRLLRPLGQEGARLLLGTGFTIPFYLRDDPAVLGFTVPGNQGRATTTAPQTYPAGLLPYLEAGIRQGRLTVVADGRLWSGSYSDDYYLVYPHNSYSGAKFYLGVTAAWAVLHQL